VVKLNVRSLSIGAGSSLAKFNMSWIVRIGTLAVQHTTVVRGPVAPLELSTL
jgi:hypothetical protein